MTDRLQQGIPAELPVRYRDPFLLVIDKPSGLAAQATRNPTLPHVYGMLSNALPYVALHHRLDVPASGLMLLGLDRRVNAPLAEAFREHQIQRSYVVVVLGDPGTEGEWNSSLDGKRAKTFYKRLHHQNGMSQLEVKLETGRTHQIRRHAVGAGHPVIGDRRHGGAAGRLWKRLALHASKLEFKHPRSKEWVQVESPYPQDLHGLMD